jgi:hypothetical protein
MTIPAVIINYGSSSHLPHVISQAKKWANPVVVVGDAAVNGRTASIEDLSEDVAEFSKNYEHLSTNGPAVELFCMNRWLILRNLMRKNKIDTCLYIDSDVLLFADPTKEWYKFSQFEFTLVHWTSGHTSFWTLKGLEGFCNLMLNTYRNKNTYEWDKIASHYHIRRKYGLAGGVCDMTLLEFYGRTRVGHVGEMMHIQPDGSTYDHIICASDQGFDMKNGHKDFKFVSGVPYVRLGDRRIRFNTLHFQAGAKSLIADAVLNA